jgi:hypothetical protein
VLVYNGDWMELTPQARDDPLGSPGVSFLAVDTAEDDEFYIRAEDKEGHLLGRVTVIDGRPVLHAPSELWPWQTP